MPLKVEWLDTQKTVMCCTGEGTWTWDEYHAALEDIARQFTAAQRRVDLVIMRGAGSSTPKARPCPTTNAPCELCPLTLG